MDADAKKTALRMIPYGIYVLTADDGKGNVAGATVNWVTQTAFAPPLVVVGVKTDSGAYSIIKGTKNFTLNMLGKEHKGLAFTFFKPAALEGGKLSGQAIHKGANGAPILDAALAAVECKVARSSSRATTTSSSPRWSRRMCRTRSRAGSTARSSKCATSAITSITAAEVNLRLQRRSAAAVRRRCSRCFCSELAAERSRVAIKFPSEPRDTCLTCGSSNPSL